MSRSYKVHEDCFYCGCVFVTSRSSQGDHFPVPRRNGGIDVVPCCPECHKLKDTIPLRRWNTEMLSKVIADFPKMSRETRLFLGKCMALFTDAIADLDTPQPHP